jgi:three-Cys-motif partner protein
MTPSELLGTDGLVVRDSGLWAEEKLTYFGRYLDIFSVGMKKKWPGELYYIDLFAGPGRCHIRDTSKEIDGSPLIALQHDFAKYFFFEADANCCKALEKRVKAYTPGKEIHIIHGDCNAKIKEVLLPKSGLGVAFVDPTGISQLSFDTISCLCAKRRIDLMINFPEGMGIRMNLHQYTNTQTNALNRFMGSSRWQERYQSKLTSFDQVCKEIAKEYLENLRTLGYLAVDGDRIPVKTDQNALLYYLLLASKNPRGNDFWRKIKHIDARGQRNLGF